MKILDSIAFIEKFNYFFVPNYLPLFKVFVSFWCTKFHFRLMNLTCNKQFCKNIPFRKLYGHLWKMMNYLKVAHHSFCQISRPKYHYNKSSCLWQCDSPNWKRKNAKMWTHCQHLSNKQDSEPKLYFEKFLCNSHSAFKRDFSSAAEHKIPQVWDRNATKRQMQENITRYLLILLS